MDSAEIWLNDTVLKHRIAKEAEQWLEANDPIYGESSTAWRQIDGKECEPPGQEVPFGGDVDLEVLVENEEGQWLAKPQRKPCGRCSYLFTPNTPWQKFCSDRCKMQSYRANSVTHS